MGHPALLWDIRPPYDEQDGGCQSGAPADAVVYRGECDRAGSDDDSDGGCAVLWITERIEGEPGRRRSGSDGDAAGIFRAGNAAANSGADQLAVVAMAIAQLPAEQQRGHLPGDDPDMVVHPILVRADSAGAVRFFIDGLIARNCQFSISARVSNPLDSAIAAEATTGESRHPVHG